MKRLPAILTGLLLPLSLRAVSITDYGWNCDGFLYCGSSEDAVQIITTNISVGVLLSITALAIIIFLYGAIRMATSQGGEGKEAGKKAIFWAAFGLVSAILVGSVVLFVEQLLFEVAS